MYFNHSLKRNTDAISYIISAYKQEDGIFFYIDSNGGYKPSYYICIKYKSNFDSITRFSLTYTYKLLHMIHK